jgi:hypothetical protein
MKTSKFVYPVSLFVNDKEIITEDFGFLGFDLCIFG